MTMFQGQKDAIETCVFCPKLCRYACPVAEVEARESVTPWGLLTHADNLRRSGELPGPESYELWSHCTGCGLCVSVCKHENPVPETLFALRAEALPDGDNALKAWAQETPQFSSSLAELPVNGRAVLVAGYASEARIEASLAILKAFGFEDVARPDGEQRHSGWRFRAAGMLAAFEETKQSLLAASSSRIMICLDSEDASVLSEALGHHNASTGVRALHITDVLGDLEQEPPEKSTDSVALFTGCTGRRSGTDPAMLKTLLENVVAGTIVDASPDLPGGGCCGRGAGYGAAHSSHGADLAQEVLSGCQEPVIAFGECAEHLRGAMPDRTVYEWTSYMASALKGENP